MIKRAGVEIKSSQVPDNKGKNKSIAQETIQICEDGYYVSRNNVTVSIASALEAAINGTVYYRDPINFIDITPIEAQIEVTNETTAEAAVRLSSLGLSNLVALNFAAARNVGGGFLSGALAQEEDLCRCSGLYPCLKTKPMFYNENILSEGGMYTDGIIYSPKVPFFRDKYNLFIEQPFELSLITSPAPNLNGAEEVDRGDLFLTLARRAQKVLAVAHDKGHQNIILGAWGCGAFGNDPKMVAAVFKAALKIVPGFKHVTFAVYDTRDNTPIYNTFKEMFE